MGTEGKTYMQNGVIQISLNEKTQLIHSPILYSPNRKSVFKVIFHLFWCKKASSYVV